MSKAYDRVEWSFLEALMRKLGFNDKWISWIMFCVTSVSYKILINGEAKGNIIHTRGLRQGDPLSPFLFIICTEALIAQIKGAEEEGRLTGLKIAQGSPAVSHLLFADDSLFFCKAEIQECAELLKIINSYGLASGQQLNREKSGILFGNRVVAEKKMDLKRAIGISKEGGMGMYLGLPETICGSKQQVFSFVQDRLNARINSRSAKFISKGGKEVLIKSIAQALPTYVMSCFLLPQNITNKLRGAISRFWWSSKNNKRGLHWLAWDKISVPLSKGGLGFRDFKEFNVALLAKQLWRLLCYPDSLLCRVLKGRYFRYSNPMEAKNANSPSFGWKSMMAAKSLLQEGLRKNIQSGFNTRVWSDNWIPTVPARPAKDKGIYRDPNLYVNHLIDFDTKEWKMDIIHNLVDPEDIPLITCLKPSRAFKTDDYIWVYTKSGQYTVKSGYSIATQGTPIQQELLEPSITTLQGQVWKLKTSRKIKHFLWQALTGCVSTCSRLMDRHCGTSRSCPRCGATDETICHMLFECPFSSQVWALSHISSTPGQFPSASLFTNFDYLFWRAKENGPPAEHLESFPWIAWYIWKARNEKVFNNKEVLPPETLALALSESKSWSVAQQIDGQGEDAEAPTEVLEHLEEQRGACWCQIDASWEGTDSKSGFGFMLQALDSKVFGQRCINRVLSPLHAEFSALLWAMESALQRGYNAVHFETDCSGIIKIIEEADDWLTFSTELDRFSVFRDRFSSFSISLISRTNNVCADRLAKSARARGFDFSHISSPVLEWLALEASFFEPT